MKFEVKSARALFRALKLYLRRIEYPEIIEQIFGNLQLTHLFSISFCKELDIGPFLESFIIFQM